MKQPTIRAAVIQGLGALLQEFSVSLEELLLDIGLDAGLEQTGEKMVTLEQLTTILEGAASATDCPHLALLLTSRQSPEILGLINLLGKSAPNLETAIIEIHKHFGLHALGIDWDLSVTNGLAISSLKAEETLFPSKQCVDLALGQAFMLLKSLTNNRWSARVIHFRYQKPRDTWFYRQLFKVPIEFNSERNGFTADASNLELTLNNYDEQMRSILYQHVATLESSRTLDFPSRVSEAIRQTLPSGQFSAADIASRLTCSERTLHRKLSMEGHTFQKLLDRERFKLASHYLRDSDLQASQIALLAGFSGLAPFSRAFRARFGVPPIEFRKNHQNLPPEN